MEKDFAEKSFALLLREISDTCRKICFWRGLSVVVHEATAASGLPESNSHPGWQSWSLQLLVCAQAPKDSKDAALSSCPLQPTLAAAGRYTINLANQQLSEEGSLLLLQGINFFCIRLIDIHVLQYFSVALLTVSGLAGAGGIFFLC